MLAASFSSPALCQSESVARMALSSPQVTEKSHSAHHYASSEHSSTLPLSEASFVAVTTISAVKIRRRGASATAVPTVCSENPPPCGDLRSNPRCLQSESAGVERALQRPSLYAMKIRRRGESSAAVLTICSENPPTWSELLSDPQCLRSESMYVE